MLGKVKVSVLEFQRLPVPDSRPLFLLSNVEAFELDLLYKDEGK